MTQSNANTEPRSDLDDCTIAQLIECGLVSRYGRDPEGLQWARRVVGEGLDSATIHRCSTRFPPLRDAQNGRLAHSGTDRGSAGCVASKTMDKMAA
jgi:hypothetical protein